MKTNFSLFLIAILKLFYGYFETKNREKIALPDRDNWMQNRFKIVCRSEKKIGLK